jgi:hypothetical protein
MLTGLMHPYSLLLGPIASPTLWLTTPRGVTPPAWHTKARGSPRESGHVQHVVITFIMSLRAHGSSSPSTCQAISSGGSSSTARPLIPACGAHRLLAACPTGQIVRRRLTVASCSTSSSRSIGSYSVAHTAYRLGQAARHSSHVVSAQRRRLFGVSFFLMLLCNKLQRATVQLERVA